MASVPRFQAQEPDRGSCATNQTRFCDLRKAAATAWTVFLSTSTVAFSFANVASSSLADSPLSMRRQFRIRGQRLLAHDRGQRIGRERILVVLEDHEVERRDAPIRGKGQADIHLTIMQGLVGRGRGP